MADTPKESILIFARDIVAQTKSNPTMVGELAGDYVALVDALAQAKAEVQKLTPRSGHMMVSMNLKDSQIEIIREAMDRSPGLVACSRMIGLTRHQLRRRLDKFMSIAEEKQRFDSRPTSEPATVVHETTPTPHSLPDGVDWRALWPAMGSANNRPPEPVDA